jgi:PHP family Zn ribbon phosphoesterase
MERSYSALAEALARAKDAARGEPAILETVEFFPQEGKYHHDGHRNCGVSRSPAENGSAGSACPVCGKPLTPGVLGRVLELADRPVSEDAPCPALAEERGNRRPYRSLIPLDEILAEILGVGAASKKVGWTYGTLIEKAGSEFAILMDLNVEDIAKLDCPGVDCGLLALAVNRMRNGEVSIAPGYDGKYGVVRALPEKR